MSNKSISVHIRKLELLTELSIISRLLLWTQLYGKRLKVLNEVYYIFWKDPSSDKPFSLTVEPLPGLVGVSGHEINLAARPPVFNHHHREATRKSTSIPGHVRRQAPRSPHFLRCLSWKCTSIECLGTHAASCWQYWSGALGVAAACGFSYRILKKKKKRWKAGKGRYWSHSTSFGKY